MNQTTETILKEISKAVKDTGSPPTLRELAKAAGFSSTAPVRYHLKKLSDAGYIKIKNNVSRGIELLKPAFGIPVLGRISAGMPIEAIENVDYYIGDVSDMFGSDGTFALRVQGDSMEGASILDGDIVFVKRQQTADNGDIVAALIDNDATVKRYFLTKNGVKLQAENPKYEPIISKNITILGKIVGVVRKVR